MWAFWTAPTVPFIGNAPDHFTSSVQKLLTHKSAHVKHLQVVETNENRQVEVFDFVTAICWSPCGRFLAIAYHDMKLMIWKESTGETTVFDLPDQFNYILYMSWRFGIGLLAVSRWGRCFTLNQQGVTKTELAVVSITAAHDTGTKLAVATTDKTVNVYQWPTKELIWSCKTHCVVGHLHWLTEDLLFLSPWEVYKIAIIEQGGRIKSVFPIKSLIDNVYKHPTNGALCVATSSVVHGDALYTLNQNDLSFTMKRLITITYGFLNHDLDE